MTDPADTTNVEIQNATPSGTPPRKRIGTALAAKRIVEDLKQSSDEWAVARARIQAMYDGHAPYSTAELKRLGRSWACNINFREAESVIDTNAAAAWSLHVDIGPLIDIRIDRFHLPADGSGDEWGSIVAEEYSRTLLEWPAFYYNVDNVTKDMFKYGIGGAVWPDEWDWRSKTFQIGNLLVPPRAKCDLEKLDLFGLRDELSLHELFALTENRAAAEKAGWNIESIKRILIEVYVDKKQNGDPEDKEQTSTWESLQAMVRSYDPDTATMEYDGVRVVHLIVKEASPGGGVSHYILPDRTTDDDAYFLFEKQGRFRQMSEVVWFLPHNYGENSKLRSIKGLGHRILPHCEFSNRFLCQLFDSGILASSMVMKLVRGQGTDTDELQMLRIGPMTVIPPSLDPVQTSFTPKMDGLVGLRSLSRDILLNNTGVYRPRTEQVANQSAYPTAQQVVQEAKTSVKFERAQATFFYIQWQMFHQETFRRMTNPEYVNNKLTLPGQQQAQMFIMRCLQRGVPPNILMTPGLIQVFSARALGLGSQDEREALTNQLIAMKPSMDEKGRKWADRQWAAARVGYWNVDSIFPRDTRDSMTGNAASFAVQENNGMLDGYGAAVGSDQAHQIHALAHAMPLSRYVEAYTKFGVKGLIDPIKAANLFRLGVPHLQAHVQILAQDPTREQQVKAWIPILQQFAKVGAAIQKEVDQMMQEQAAQQEQAQPQQPDPETMIALAKNQKDLQLGAMKIDSLNAQRMQKAEAQIQQNAARTQAQLQLDAARQAEQLKIEKAKAEAEIALKTAKAAGAAAPAPMQ